MSARRGVWQYPNFVRSWLALAISTYGSRITRTALPILAITVLHQPESIIGVLVAGQLAPGVVLALVAGGFVDRSDKRLILVWADVVRAAAIVSLTVAWVIGALTIAHLFIVGAIVGAASALFRITDTAYLPTLVGTELLGDGNAVIEATEGVAEIVGPASAGALIAALGAPLAVAIDAVTYLWSAMFLVRIKPPFAEAVPSTIGESRSIAGDEPSTVDETPSTVDKAPSTVDEAPSTVDNTPSTVDDAPSTVDESRFTVDEAPSTVDDAPSTVDEAPSTVDKAPSTIDEAPSTVDETRSSVDESRFTVDEAPSTIDETPSAVDNARPPVYVGRGSLRADLAIGMRALFGDAIVRPITIAYMLWSLWGGFFMALYPPFLLRELHLGEAWFGVVVAMGGVGALFGAVFSRASVKRFGLGNTIIVSSALSLAAGLFVPSARGSFIMVIAFLVAHQILADGFSVAFVVQETTLRQTVIPKDILGRANAAFHVCTQVPLPIGALVGGALATAFDTRTALWIGITIGLLPPLLMWPLRRVRVMPTAS